MVIVSLSMISPHWDELSRWCGHLVVVYLLCAFSDMLYFSGYSMCAISLLLLHRIYSAYLDTVCAESNAALSQYFHHYLNHD